MWKSTHLGGLSPGFFSLGMVSSAPYGFRARFWKTSCYAWHSSKGTSLPGLSVFTGTSGLQCFGISVSGVDSQICLSSSLPENVLSSQFILAGAVDNTETYAAARASYLRCSFNTQCIRSASFLATATIATLAATFLEWLAHIRL
jgi:hypothetical protein